MMKKLGRPKKSGGKLGRIEIIQTRISPRLRFMSELVATSERRTLSSLTDWALEEYLQNKFVIVKGSRIAASQFVESVWDDLPVLRFINVFMLDVDLLCQEERQIANIITNEPLFWTKGILNKKLVIEMWESLREFKLDKNQLQQTILKHGQNTPKFEQLKLLLEELYGEST